MRAMIALLLCAVSAPGLAADALDLHRAVEAACSCSIVGVSVGRKSDRSTWRIDYAAGASDDQKNRGKAAVAAFDMAGASTAPVDPIDALRAAIKSDPTLLDKVKALK